MGVPAVIEPLGSTSERVSHGVTGRVTEDDDGFVTAAVALLREDRLWDFQAKEPGCFPARRRWHLASLERQCGLSWDAVGARLEALMPHAPTV